MNTPGTVDRSLQGIGLCTLGYAFLALQDAVIKWLVADYSVVTILFWRSLFVVFVCLVAGRLRLVQKAWRSPSRRLLVQRGLLSIVAWVLYYTAARDLSLAEMTTLYFSAPIMVTVLAAVFLKERANGWQWFTLIVGFVGVIIACRPNNIAEPLPVVLTLLAAMCWAFTYIQLRQVDDQTSVLEQMLITNVVFVICMTVALPLDPHAVADPGLAGDARGGPGRRYRSVPVVCEFPAGHGDVAGAVRVHRADLGVPVVEPDLGHGDGCVTDDRRRADRGQRHPGDDLRASRLTGRRRC